MRITRREFINVACTSAALLLSGVPSFGQRASKEKLFPVPPEAYANPLFSLTATKLSKFIGRTFTVTREGIPPTALVLLKVDELERSENTLRGFYGDCFSLIFEGNEGNQLAQESYLLETDGLTPFSALLVPIGPEHTKYELIVNRITR